MSILGDLITDDKIRNRNVMIKKLIVSKKEVDLFE